MYCKSPTFFVFNLTNYIIAIKNSQSQIFRTIYRGGQQYVWGHKLDGARKNYFKIYGAVKKRSQLESFLFSIFFLLQYLVGTVGGKSYYKISGTPSQIS